MKEITATEFKAKCLAVVEQVRKTRKPVRITRYGKPVAEIRATTTLKKSKRKNWTGSMAGTVEILGDIVSPTFGPL